MNPHIKINLIPSALLTLLQLRSEERSEPLRQHVASPTFYWDPDLRIRQNHVSTVQRWTWAKLVKMECSHTATRWYLCTTPLQTSRWRWSWAGELLLQPSPARTRGDCRTWCHARAGSGWASCRAWASLAPYCSGCLFRMGKMHCNFCENYCNQDVAGGKYLWGWNHDYSAFHCLDVTSVTNKLAGNDSFIISQLVCCC